MLDFVHQAGPAPFVPDVVGDHTHTHPPRRHRTRQYKPCPLETAAARVESARRCCVLAAAGPIACGVCLHLKKATRSPLRGRHQAAAQKFDRSRFFRSILPRKSHIRQKGPYALGAAAECVLVTRCSCGVPYGFRDRQRFELVPKITTKMCKALSSHQIEAAFARIREQHTRGRTSPTGLAYCRQE